MTIQPTKTYEENTMEFPCATILHKQDGVQCELLRTEDDVLIISEDGNYIQAAEHIVLEGTRFLKVGDRVSGLLVLTDEDTADIVTLVKSNIPQFNIEFHVNNFYNVFNISDSYVTRMGTLAKQLIDVMPEYTFKSIKLMQCSIVNSQDTLNTYIQGVLEDEDNLGVIIQSLKAGHSVQQNNTRQIFTSYVYEVDTVCGALDPQDTRVLTKNGHLSIGAMPWKDKVRLNIGDRVIVKHHKTNPDKKYFVQVVSRG